MACEVFECVMRRRAWVSLLVGGLGLPTHLDGSGAGDLAATPLTLPLPLLPLFHPSSHLPFSFSPSFLYVLPSLTYPLLYPPPFPLLPLFPLPSYSLYLLPFPSVLPAFLPSFLLFSTALFSSLLCLSHFLYLLTSLYLFLQVCSFSFPSLLFVSSFPSLLLCLHSFSISLYLVTLTLSFLFFFGVFLFFIPFA